VAVSAGRIVGAGLAATGVLIVALCIGVLFALDREGSVHQDAIDQVERSDRLESLRTSLAALGHSAQLVAADSAGALPGAVEEAALRIESALTGMPAATRDFMASRAEVERLSRLAVLNARSVASARHDVQAAEERAREAQRTAEGAALLLERELQARGAILNRDAARQIRAGRNLRIAVTVALVSALGLIGVVFALYRAARRRERAALARIEQLAHFDSLTGLPNRTLIRDRLHQEAARSRRSGKPFAVLLFDLDGFKAVNDTHGHAAGDAALRVAASRAREALRSSDSLGRLGGDEFLAVLPETASDGALSVAAKLGEALRQPYPLPQGSARMSASIGVACFPADAEEEERLLHVADVALYQAKRHGKDRVERAVPERTAALAV
jgi:diguanylate cyclase (GGDEF)-like protein